MLDKGSGTNDFSITNVELLAGLLAGGLLWLVTYFDGRSIRVAWAFSFGRRILPA